MGIYLAEARRGSLCLTGSLPRRRAAALLEAHPGAVLITAKDRQGACDQAVVELACAAECPTACMGDLTYQARMRPVYGLGRGPSRSEAGMCATLAGHHGEHACDVCGHRWWRDTEPLAGDEDDD